MLGPPALTKINDPTAERHKLSKSYTQKLSYLSILRREAMSGFSRNAQCVLRILELSESMLTSEILETAKQPEYVDLCSDCAGGDAFIAAANQLASQGLITKKFGKGGYRWHLVEAK
jgi:hypothetical protein